MESQSILNLEINIILRQIRILSFKSGAGRWIRFRKEQKKGFCDAIHRSLFPVVIFERGKFKKRNLKTNCKNCCTFLS